jgi:hypothetical protein
VTSSLLSAHAQKDEPVPEGYMRYRSVSSRLSCELIASQCALRMLNDEPRRYFRDVIIALTVLKHGDTNRKRTREQKIEKHAKDDKEKRGRGTESRQRMGKRENKDKKKIPFYVLYICYEK